jgi:pyruvate dehydrogenase E2 component (dihydrolipoamide acetyltransferase)
MDFRLPPLGEGIDSATVVAVKVKPGDAVSAGQELIEVETDKASMPITAEAAGTVDQVRVKPGDKLPVGAVVLTLSGASANGTAKTAVAPAASPPPAAAPISTPPPPAAAAQPSAPSRVEFTLPALGEGIEGGTVVSVKVKPGDTITSGQDLIEVETDKASMPVPSDVAGKVEEVKVKPGDKVSVGAVLAVLTTTGGTVEAKMPAGGASRGPGDVTAATSPPPPAKNQGVDAPRSPASAHTANGKKDLTPAGPATRRLARELGVTLMEVKPSGRGGRVTLDDVKGFVRTERQQVKAGGGSFSGSVVNAFTLPPLPDFSKFGEVEKKPVAKIRETIAKNLTIAWRTMPMVTQNDLADITDLEAGRKRIVETLPKGAPKITWTVLAVKACVAALKEFPNFNSSYDMNAGELILKKYFHIGIAVDTERGLVVPVIKDADKKSVRDIATEVQTLAEKARAGKLAIDEMRGGTFTITNLGGIGGTSFTPIVNYPEVAILGMCRSALQPAVKDGQIVPRLMLPLSLTYDHRVIDGADGARFTTRLVQLFSDPMRLLMES